MFWIELMMIVDSCCYLYEIPQAAKKAYLPGKCSDEPDNQCLIFIVYEFYCSAVACEKKLRNKALEVLMQTVVYRQYTEKIGAPIFC